MRRSLLTTMENTGRTTNADDNSCNLAIQATFNRLTSYLYESKPLAQPHHQNALQSPLGSRTRDVKSSDASKFGHNARYNSTLGEAASSVQGPGQAITLPSGRKLGYHTSGPADGTPVIYIHGHPDSGITITGPLETRIAEELDIRWVGPDRPGVGLSTPYAAQTVLDYPADIRALAEQLQLQEYYILGTSGGTGFTLACAKDLPQSQLKGVGVCAGVGPLECGFESMDKLQQTALEGWRDYPAEFREHYEKEYVPLAQQDDTSALTERLRGELEAAFTGRDRDLLLQESAVEMAVKSLKQAWMQGAWAQAKGMEIHWQPWGFKLEDVSFPGIKLWYGEKDVSTTPVMGKYMAERLAGSKYREYAGASHYTIWDDGILQEIVRDLIASSIATLAQSNLQTILQYENPNIKMTVPKSSTCCGKDNVECACAKQATCSCGQKSAMHCTCDKASSENKVEGPRCSCRARPAGECTCDRAATENTKPAGATCQCGARPVDACTCEKAADGGFNPANEVDFTNLK
ncbi:Proline iminopeptidase [Paramyrothecium foliicola]|nr:Proline iminopeptidase [Paramyrothecium foliicola]